jgi:hypothetical protein
MGKMYKVVSEQDIINATVKSTKEYNDKQEYEEDGQTYFERFIADKDKILEQAEGKTQYTTVSLTPDRVYPKMDIDSFLHTLAMKQLEDMIDNDKDLSELKKLKASGDLVIHDDREYASIDFISDEYTKASNDNTFVLTIEPSTSGGRLKDGFHIMTWDGESGSYKSNIKDALIDTQSHVKSFIEINLQDDDPAPVKNKMKP